SNGVAQISNFVPQLTGVFKWNPASSDWLFFTGTEILIAGSVFWLRSPASVLEPIIGSYLEPTNRLTSGADFLPSAGLESWNIGSTFSNFSGIAAQGFDPRNDLWFSASTAALRSISDLPPFMSPGQALFVQTPT